MNEEMRGRINLEVGRKAIDDTREKIERGEWNGLANMRATARLVEGTLLEGRIGRFTFQCDEPPARGGEDKAPSPLEYFLIGAAF